MDLKLLASEDGTVAVSSGLRECGLPNVARSIPAGGRLEDVATPMIDLVKRMVDEQWYPQNGERFHHQTVFLLRRVQDSLWMQPIDEAHDHARDQRARYAFGVERCLELLLKTELFMPVVQGGSFRVDHYQGLNTTNGLGLQHLFEIVCFTEKAGPRIDQLLTAIADMAEKRTLSRFDRIAHPRPLYGISGHVLWPAGHILPIDDHPKIELFDALPILGEELAAFRTDPGAQQRWIDERYERKDVHEIQARWNLVFDS